MLALDKGTDDRAGEHVASWLTKEQKIVVGHKLDLPFELADFVGETLDLSLKFGDFLLLPDGLLAGLLAKLVSLCRQAVDLSRFFAKELLM